MIKVRLLSGIRFEEASLDSLLNIEALLLCRRRRKMHEGLLGHPLTYQPDYLEEMHAALSCPVLPHRLPDICYLFS